jgi:thioredoxin-like negative regulator of GroEL
LRTILLGSNRKEALEIFTALNHPAAEELRRKLS